MMVLTEFVSFWVVRFNGGSAARETTREDHYPEQTTIQVLKVTNIEHGTPQANFKKASCPRDPKFPPPQAVILSCCQTVCQKLITSLIQVMTTSTCCRTQGTPGRHVCLATWKSVDLVVGTLDQGSDHISFSNPPWFCLMWLLD